MEENTLLCGQVAEHTEEFNIKAKLFCLIFITNEDLITNEEKYIRDMSRRGIYFIFLL